LLVVDPLYREVSGQFVPVGCFVSMNGCASRDVRPRDGDALGFQCANVRHGMAAALTHGDDDLALAGLVNLAAAVLAIVALIGRLQVSTEVSAINLHITAQGALLTGERYGLRQLVTMDEGGVVIDAQITGRLEGRISLGAVREYRERPAYGYERWFRL
jgi:hypothetical protein